jgi:hypothetical protein
MQEGMSLAQLSEVAPSSMILLLVNRTRPSLRTRTVVLINSDLVRISTTSAHRTGIPRLMAQGKVLRLATVTLTDPIVATALDSTPTFANLRVPIVTTAIMRTRVDAITVIAILEPRSTACKAATDAMVQNKPAIVLRTLLVMSNQMADLKMAADVRMVPLEQKTTTSEVRLLSSSSRPDSHSCR